MSKIEFPKEISVRRDCDVDAVYYVAEEKAEDLIEDDGPTIIALYKLVSVHKVSKRIVIDDETVKP